MAVTQKLDDSEDLNFGGNTPFIDLTPLDLWGAVIKRAIGVSAWDLVCTFVVERAKNDQGIAVCEFCGAGDGVKGLMGKGAKKFQVEPRFEFDPTTGNWVLRRLIHSCNQCCQAIHLRQTQLQSRGMPDFRSPLIGAVARLIKFSNDQKTKEDIFRELDIEIAKKRSAVITNDNLDISMLVNGAKRLMQKR